MFKSKCLVPKTSCSYPTPTTNLFLFQYNQYIFFLKYGKSSKIDKCVFSCRLANDTVHGVEKSPKAALTAGYTTYDLKDIHDAWQRHVCWGFFTRISWKAKLFFQFPMVDNLVSVCNLWLFQKALFGLGICHTAVLVGFFPEEKRTIYSLVNTS